MPQLAYVRVDLHIAVHRVANGGAVIELGEQGALRRTRVRPQTVSQWLDLKLSGNILDLRRKLSFGHAVQNWVQRIRQSRLSLEQSPDSALLYRLTLDVADPELAGLPWETTLRRLLNDEVRLTAQKSVFGDGLALCPIVRVSDVRPHVISRPFTLPLRILHLNPQPERPVGEWLRQLFSGRSAVEVAGVVEVETATLGEAGIESFPANWPTIEALFFDNFSMLAGAECLLSTAAVDTPGTLGWLSRWTDIWQTRLVIIQARNSAEMARACRLGTALTNRGGPAALIISPAYKDKHLSYLNFFYSLICDFPHDRNFSVSFPHISNTDPCILFAGTEREDALRMSNVGTELLRMEEELSSTTARRSSRTARELRTLLRSHEATERYRISKPTNLIRRIHNTLGSLREEWNDYHFEQHERQSAMPLAETLNKLRQLTNVEAPTRSSEQPAASARRYVNASLWANTTAGDFIQIPQNEARLKINEIYHLGIQIGPFDLHVRTIGTTALLEEIFKWTPEMKGIWLEVAVTGLDFEVRGDPVQELWLPREGNSDPIYFAIVPRIGKVARLRFSIYHQQNVIQSFRLAALVNGPTEEAAPLAMNRRRLARSLGVSPELVGDVGYLPRLEYSISTEIQHLETRPSRALSIVANEIGGKKVLTIKGADVFGVRIPRDLKDHVRKIRDALKVISTPPIDKVEINLWRYGWGGVDPYNPALKKLNRGRTEKLSQALTTLADVGWQLFSALIPNEPARGGEESLRTRLARLLEPEGQVIHVAHTLLQDVLPWAALYDRKYDARKQTEQGKPVEQAVCLAALPAEDGKLPFANCEESPQCLLHQQQQDERRKQNKPPLMPEMVACPLHFWGFKHIVEVPPQQVSEQQEETVQQQDCIRSVRPVKLAAGLNTDLQLFDEHLAELNKLTSRTLLVATWAAQKYLRDDVLDMMQETTLDLIYLYCHARGSKEENIFPPYLEFWDKQHSHSDYIYSSDLDYPDHWLHHPLVFLNGCGTAGFNPEALSPFIEKLVTDRGASAVIGTEIPVWEQLASECALRFLEHFLNGDTAGTALLNVRRELLAQNNPLGLVYTLYGAAHLILATDGQCPNYPGTVQTPVARSDSLTIPAISSSYQIS
jgi:hypothetical protein